jgi:uncharacterized protein (TIGR02453 family)
MAKPTWFTPDSLSFLAELRANNDRAWFAENRERWESEVRGPALRYVTDFGKRLAKLSPHFVADPRPQGGSLFRIHRDTRFSKDKSPYKTSVGIQFRHETGRDAHAPGFYLHVEPGGCFVGAGIWHPDSATLGRLRRAIVDDPAGWKRASRGAAFRRDHRLAGDSLVRAPRGFDAEHPLVDDLRRKDFIAVADLHDSVATGPDLLSRHAALARSALPLVRWLCSALDLRA